MGALRCENCGQEFAEWVEFCPHCSEPVPGYARPAGFWIRVGAYVVDALIFIPIGVLAVWNMLSLKSITVLILLSLPGFIYKPFMESFFGATLGKMACGIKVINAEGQKLSLFNAYVRAFPFLLSSAITLASAVILYSSPQFQAATSLVEIGQAQSKTFLDMVKNVVGLLVVVDCVVVAFTFRKRALHDMLAESYCVYKEA